MKKLIMVVIMVLMLCIPSMAEEYKTIYLKTIEGDYALKIPKYMDDFTTFKNKNFVGLHPPNLCVIEYDESNAELYSLFVVCDKIEVLALARLAFGEEVFFIYRNNIPISSTKNAFIEFLKSFAMRKGV